MDDTPTLRDAFAMVALHGLLTATKVDFRINGHVAAATEREFVEAAFIIADKCMKQRGKADA